MFKELFILFVFLISFLSNNSAFAVCPGISIGENNFGITYFFEASDGSTSTNTYFFPGQEFRIRCCSDDNDPSTSVFFLTGYTDFNGSNNIGFASGTGYNAVYTTSPNNILDPSSYFVYPSSYNTNTINLSFKNIIMGGTMTSNSVSITLYTHHVVTLNHNGGSNGTDSVMAVPGLYMPIATAPVREGYKFKGYYTGMSGTGEKYYEDDMSSSQVWNKTSNTTLFANWSQISIFAITGLP